MTAQSRYHELHQLAEKLRNSVDLLYHQMDVRFAACVVQMKDGSVAYHYSQKPLRSCCIACKPGHGDAIVRELASLADRIAPSGEKP